MKKRNGPVILLLIFAAVAGLLVFVWKQYGGNSSVKVNGYTVTDYSAPSEFGGIGVLKEASYSGYYYDIPIKVSKVCVKAGDRIKAGDPLLEVDMTATETAVKMMASGYITYNTTGSETVAEAAKITAMNAKTSVQLMEDLAKVAPVLYAAYDCTVCEVNCSENEFSTPYEPLLTVSDMTDFTAVITVPESLKNRITIGESALVSGIFSDLKYPAEVISVSPRAIASTSAGEAKFDITVSITGTDDSFAPNASVNVVFEDENAIGGIFVPYSCLCCDGDETSVFRADNGLAKKTEVSCVKTLYNGVVVSENDLRAGDIIIEHPPASLTDGSAIEVAK